MSAGPTILIRKHAMVETSDASERASLTSLPRVSASTVWILLWRAEVLFPLESIDAAGSSCPILIITAPLSKPTATLRSTRGSGFRHNVYEPCASK